MRFPLVIPQGARPRTPVEPAVFFESVLAAFQQARHAAGGSVDRDYVIAGFRVRLCFAGTALLPYITPALAHLASGITMEPDLTINLWDMQTTGIAAPPPPWDYQDFDPSGLIRSYSTEQLYTLFQLGTNALCQVDLARNLALYWVKAAQQIPYYDTGSPLRLIFHLWLSQHGLLLAHAGAVGLPEGGVLLAGESGSGKSNTALSTLRSRLQYASDDYCLLSAEPRPTVFSLYSTGKTHAGDLRRLPFLDESISNRDRLADQKALYFLHERWAHKLLNEFPVQAVLLPHITGEHDSRLRPASAAAGMNALAPSTFQQLAAVRQNDFQVLVNVFRQLPCYHLDLGTDVAQPAGLILELLNQRA
jgi:hypothetical protein